MSSFPPFPRPSPVACSRLPSAALPPSVSSHSARHPLDQHRIHEGQGSTSGSGAGPSTTRTVSAMSVSAGAIVLGVIAVVGKRGEVWNSAYTSSTDICIHDTD
ncbi:hypothetical protein MSAN_00128700 [Mycena sanguinolenta]|uniref:Uncharacterized protein n=1 Tax=Mycena sanguinolenta TaxID=230812 RepID=A0A8H6ZGI0_9AGAR|nr:hypothetical protein MSAN_00128700 [Mycena sanguinolenta]